MKRIAMRGFTLVEMLLVIVILGIVAKAALPLLSSNDPQKLNVAAEETANTLRYAISEAKRTGGYVLVDGKSTPGHLKLYVSNINAQKPPVVGTSEMVDPLTKRAFDLDVNSNAFSQGVVLLPQFKAGAQEQRQLLIGPSELTVFDTPSNYGPLQENSGVQLTLGSQSLMVNIHQTTRLVTLQ